MKSRRYEKQSIDAPVELEFALEPIRFDTVEQMLNMLHNLVDMGFLRIKKVSSQNYEFECIGAKQNLYKLFPVDIYGNTYFRPHIDHQINEQNTGSLSSVLLKMKNAPEGISAVHYRNHIPKLEYDELTVDTLLSATFLNKVEPKLADEKTKNSIPRLVNIIHPTYTRTSDKYDFKLEKQKFDRMYLSEAEKAKLPPLPMNKSLIKVLFPCGTTATNVTDRMLDFDKLPNKATQSLIELYYLERFTRLLELRQIKPATPEDAINIKQTIKEIDHERVEVEDALESLIDRLQKQQIKFNEIHPHIDAAIEKEFPYGFLILEDVKRKLYFKEKCTKRMTNTLFPLYLTGSVVTVPFYGLGAIGLVDIIKHRPHAKRNMDYALMLHEYRRIAAHNGHAVIPHIPQDAEEQRRDELRQAQITAKINEKRNNDSKYPSTFFGGYTFDEKAYVHFANIDQGMTQRIRELQTYLTRIQSLAPASVTELTSITDNTVLPYTPGRRSG